MANSANSQDRTAKALEEAAEYFIHHKDEYRGYAARHREFAQDDRRMAEQLRQMAEID
jgi:hypothetical protein